MMQALTLRITVLWIASGLLIAQEPGAVAERMWTDFRSVNWQDDVTRWRQTRAGAHCRRSEITTMSVPNAEDEFCRECITAAAGVSSSHFFYAFDLEPLACTLLQFHATWPAASSEAASHVYNDLRRRLAHEYGPGGDAGKVTANCSAYWRNTWVWQRPEFEALLFLNDCSGPVKVELLARHRRLLKTKTDDARIAAMRWENFQARERQFYAALADRLETGLPKLHTLLAATEPRTLDADTVLAHLRILIALAEVSEAHRKPTLLLAADRLAGMLGHLWKAPFDRPQRRQLRVGQFILAYEWSHLGDTWAYDHALLRHVCRTYGDTEAGEWAFITLENRGWYTGAGCPSDPALFRRVIAEAGPFLERHRNSRYRLDVLFDLAQAYDTWWSLSQASPQDSYVQASKYAAGAEDARQRAIELYERVLREAPEGDFAACAMRMLPRLKLRGDTGQRRYYCIYD